MSFDDIHSFPIMTNAYDADPFIMYFRKVLAVLPESLPVPSGE